MYIDFHNSAKKDCDRYILCVLDIDECTLEESACRKNQECRNTFGSYNCALKCGIGFTAASNGLDCQGTVSVH